MKWGLALALLLLEGGCPLRPPHLGEPVPTLPDGEAERSYQAVLERSSARAELYSGLDTQAFVATTLQSPIFREARARRESAFRNETLTELDARLTREREEAAAFHEFFLGVFIEDSDFDDLDRKNSVWRLAMVTPAGEVLPVSVKRMGRSNPAMRAFYPYMDRFWTAYRVRFPREVAGQATLPPDAKEVMLQVASPLGRANLVVPAP